MKTVRLSHSTLMYREGVLIIELGENVEIGPKEAKEQLKASQKLTDGKSAPVIIVDNHLKTTTTPEAREILSAGPDAATRICEAFVVSSLPKRMMVNFYTKFHKPKNPVKIFSNFNEAWNWSVSMMENKN